MRARTSSSCLWLSALVSALAKCASGIVDTARCGLTNAAACGIATCEWMSTVMLFGRTWRPGLPCLRAAVAAYLFHCAIICLLFVDFVARTPAARSRASGNQKPVTRDLGAGSALSGGRADGASSHIRTSEHAEVLGDNGVVELDLIGAAAKHHAAGVDDDDIVGKVERELDVLLDQHDRMPLRLELRNGAADLGDELR